jgi:hypothetical protein
MSINSSIANAQALQNELVWFENFLFARAEFGQESHFVTKDFLLLHSLPDENDDIIYYKVLNEIHDNTIQKYLDIISQTLQKFGERITLILALVPHIRPQLLDIFFHQNQFGRDFTEFGGIKGTQHKGFLPTGETLMYLLAGHNLELRFFFQQIFEQDNYLYKRNIIKLEQQNSNEPFFSGQMVISPEYLQLLTTGKPYSPQYSQQFPATRISSDLEWEDLVLDYHTQQEIYEVRTWIRHYKALMQDKKWGKEVKGYKCLFYGESGTGKTLTTKLLGKDIGAEVYRIDLSKVVSKYVGETEKNLSHVFDVAEYRNWILFFDEGDALFGKRSESKSSNDRYANQETAYLLQRIEEYTGILLLATNIKTNLDKAFMRRFQSEVYFGIPNESSRLLLWQKSFGNKYKFDERINFHDIAKRYEMSGANIKNVALFCIIMEKDRKDNFIHYEDFKDGLRKQLAKEGKVM